jgi:hypothetical protein
MLLREWVWRDFRIAGIQEHIFKRRTSRWEGAVWNIETVRYHEVYRRNIDLCVSGESKGFGPLILPPRATGVLPVQNIQTYTGGRLLELSPRQLMCDHLLQLSHCSNGRPSSGPLQTQRVISLERLLLSVEGVVSPSVLGEPLNELVNGS